MLARRGDAIIVRAPATIAGLIEVRGVGIVRVEALAEAPVALIADLVPRGPDRAPAGAAARAILGIVAAADRRSRRSRPPRRRNCGWRCARLADARVFTVML